MTDTTTVQARRALLAVLLDRVDRDALLPAERPLLRALVTAEQADAARRLENAHTEGARLAREMGDMRRERDTERQRADDAEATFARVRALAGRWLHVPGLKGSPRATLLRALTEHEAAAGDRAPDRGGFKTGGGV